METRSLSLPVLTSLSVDLPGEVRKWIGEDPHRIAQSKDSLFERFVQLRVHTSDFTVLVSGYCTRMFVFRDTMLYRFHSCMAAGSWRDPTKTE